MHVWPLGARETLRAAARLGIPTVLERPNAHTRFAYEVVAKECERLGITLPPDHEHAYNAEILRHEEEEYELADYLLCPSDFVVKTFLDQGFPQEKLLRHTYGFDPSVFSPPAVERPERAGLTVLFAGVAAVRKGLHLALEAWLRSPASAAGTFLIAGDFVPAYRERLSELLAHPSVQALGHRTDLAELMRSSDVLVLPSLEEGYGLVCVEAIGCGCVPLVSDACTEVCRHMENALVHQRRRCRRSHRAPHDLAQRPFAARAASARARLPPLPTQLGKRRERCSLTPTAAPSSAAPRRDITPQRRT